MELMMIGFESRADGETAYESLDDARHDDEILLEDMALIYRNDRGRPKVKQTNDATLGKGLMRGGVLGLLVGVVAPWAIPGAAVVSAAVAGAAVTTVAGGALGGIVTAFDEGIDNKMMKNLAKNLEVNESVLLCLGEKTQIELLANALAPYSANVQYEIVPEETQKMIKEMAKLSPDQLGSR